MPKALQNRDLNEQEVGSADDYAEELGVRLEQALFDKFAENKKQILKTHAKSKTKSFDVGQKYRAKFRSLSVILKDEKNPELHKRIVSGELAPEEFVVLSRDELLNPALKQIADAVRAESIRNSILVVDDGPRIRRTHKGEEYIDDAFEEQQKPQEWKEEPIFNVPSRESTVEKSVEPVASERKSASKSPRNSPALAGPQEHVLPSLAVDSNNTNEDYNNYHNHYNDYAEEQGDNKVEVDIEDGVDLDDILNSDHKDQKTQKFKRDGGFDDVEENDDYDPFFEPDSSETKVTTPKDTSDIAVYTGQVSMPSVSDFPGTAVHLSGPSGFNPHYSWTRVVDPMAPISIEGRLDRARAEKYLKAVGQSKDIVSFVLKSDETDSSIPQYSKLFNYFSKKDKYGVITRSRPPPSEHGPPIPIKDAYLIPLKEGDAIPDHLWLTSFEYHQKLQNLLKTNKRVLIALYVLTTSGVFERPPRPSESQPPQAQPSQNAGPVTDPRALLMLLQQMNGGASSSQTPPQNVYENDDEYEP